MNLSHRTANVLIISDVPSLDQIQVYWLNLAPGQGHVTIVCYGQAWAAYFGAMSNQTIESFFQSAPSDYLCTKLGISPLLKARKSDLAYLTKIILAIKSALSLELVQAIDQISKKGLPLDPALEAKLRSERSFRDDSHCSSHGGHE